ncbi:hypothetical protein [Candidatus Pristimantibacillus sp. PTI5]|uniref:hypothetical protein n=1 Tax=Candidatus Pristimantibacillus sp. PTI5 TaxID=3400422 RepID=UPI003B01631A
MEMYMFRFLFNITLSLPEDSEYKVNYKGHESLIKLKTIKGANISSYRGEDYSWVTKIEENLITARIKLKTEDIVQKYIKYYNNEHHFSGGVIEPTNFSIIEVFLTIPNKHYLEKNLDQLERDASEIINYTINAYRLIFQENEISLPQASDSPAIEIWFSESVDKGNGYIDHNFLPFSQNYNFKKKKRDKNGQIDDNLKLFKEFIYEGVAISLYQELMLDAIEQGEIRKKYEVTVVKIGTAFEIFMQGLLVSTCEKLNIDKLQTGRGTKHYKLAIQEGKLIEDLLKKYLKTFVDTDSILSVKEYNHWHSKAYTLRNEIVHNGRTNVSEIEANKAFVATNNLVSLITNKVNQVLQKDTYK